jgi:hypothetical protein
MGLRGRHGHGPFLVYDVTPYHRCVIRLTRWVPQVEQKLLTIPRRLSSSPVFSGVRVTRSLVLCVYFVDRCLSLCPFFFWPLCCLSFFLLAIVLSVLFRFTDSDYTFGIFKLFLQLPMQSWNAYHETVNPVLSVSMFHLHFNTARWLTNLIKISQQL